MYTEIKEIDKIEVIGAIILTREVTTVFKDGVKIAQSFHRTSLTPNQDISSQPQNVQDICNVVWTQEVKDAYMKSILENSL